MRLVLCICVALAMGCKKVEPADRDLDALLHWFWSEFDASEEDMNTSVAELVALTKDEEDTTDGSVSRLTDSEIEDLNLSDRDPADAAGVYMLNRFACEPDVLQQTVTHLAQDELYEGVYDSYSREYTSDHDAWLAKETDLLEWQSRYTVSVLGSTYESTIDVQFRRLQNTATGTAFVLRGWIPEPAIFDTDKKSLEQDYQLEIFVEQDGGSQLHAYSIWRQADFGSGFSSEDEGIQRLLLNNLANWDETTEEICSEGGP